MQLDADAAPVSARMLTVCEAPDVVHTQDSENVVKAGDSVVTSHISDKYMPGLLIGYVTSISEDDNHLTKSGKITPVVDFKHLQDVLVITTKKETSDGGSETTN